MNKSRVFTANIKDIEASTERFHQGAAFGSIHFDGAGQRAAVSAAIGIIEDAQPGCMDYLLVMIDLVRTMSEYSYWANGTELVV